MEAVYKLLDIERGIPEPWGSQYDIRALLNAGAVMRDGAKIQLPAPIKALVQHLSGVEDLEKTEIYELLRDYGWVGELGDDRLTVAIYDTPPRVHETVL
jgi:oleate hydratase